MPGFINCCRVVNENAALFDGPLKTAAAVGSIDEGEGVKYPYGVSAAEGSRARLFHDVHDSVWIEITELDPVCVRLRHHPNCSSAYFLPLFLSSMASWAYVYDLLMRYYVT